MDLLSFRHSVATVGWAVTVPIIDATEVSELRACVTAHARSGRGGARNLLDDPQIASLAAAPVLRQFADVVLGKACFAVRAIFFDKTRDANWKVIWHQDLTVAVQQRIDLLGYGPWTDKAGVPHVQPPVDILEHMLAIRIHLDPCGDDNGPVRVLDGTHRLGRLTPQAIDELRAQRAESVCLADEGAILAFHPLLLHASSPATRPQHRRVIHIEYAVRALAPPLVWHRQVA
ncbi:MAG TPA: phytanoyl-CoA dioxygenase family protein [Gemmatimonadaceae bacterium]|nr:phytanoyl-CoA dioxygenase family protein [Gemmatimonadaceae bacterium]